MTNGRIKMVEAAGFEKETISRKLVPLFMPRTCLRGLLQAQNAQPRTRKWLRHRDVVPGGSDD